MPHFYMETILQIPKERKHISQQFFRVTTMASLVILKKYPKFVE